MKNGKAATILIGVITLVISLIIMVAILVTSYISGNGIFKEADEIVKPEEFKPLEYSDKKLYSFSEGDYAGYYDEGLNVKIEPQYDFANEFSSGVAVASKDGKVGVIDAEGKTIFDFKYDEIRDFIGGYSTAKVDNQFYVLDIEGNEFKVDERIDYCNNFREGRAVFTIGKKSGVIDTKGKVVVKAIYSDLTDYVDGIATAHKFLSGDKIIDRNGNILDKKFLSNKYRDGVYIDETGIVFDYYKNEIKNISSQYKSEDVVDNKIIVLKRGSSKYGIVDKKGKIILKPKYDNISSNSKFETFFVRENGQNYMVDIKGNKIVELDDYVKDAYFESEDLIRVIYSYDMEEIINTKGDVIVTKDKGKNYVVNGNFIIKEIDDNGDYSKKVDIHDKNMKLLYSDEVEVFGYFEYQYDERYIYTGKVNNKNVINIRLNNGEDYYLNTDGKVVRAY
ncbi:MAG: WG repeat-containing protein [Clostridium sp.]|uniref:WG repeat-containing protein n=1 Tax=Clostridium sp. TaxID=1506 RepID=UPI002FC5E52F